MPSFVASSLKGFEGICGEHKARIEIRWNNEGETISIDFAHVSSLYNISDLLLAHCL